MAYLLFLALGAIAEPAAVDAKALAAANQVVETLGGEAAWKATRFLRFDFAYESEGKILSSRSHYWDKWSGRYRVEGKTKEGAYVVLMNLNTKEGSAWLDGKPARDAAEAKLLELAYGVWVNDSYWLLMPYKLRDPGVVLTYDGELREGGAVYDRLALRFENVGLTPKDRYWVFVDRESHLVARWEYVLEGEKGPKTRWDWKGWKRFGAIRLAPERLDAKSRSRILFPVLDTPKAMDDAVFSSPNVVP